MEEFVRSVISEIGIFDVIDILIVAYVIYRILGFIVKTRAVQILKGVLVLIVALVVSEFLDLYTLNWLCKGAVAVGAVAILIVFQPELRRALEYVGRGSFMRPGILQENKEQVKHDVNQIVRAIDDFSANHVGALIVFEGQTLLEDIVETGTVLDATISEQLLGNIFYEGSPLHDGAVIIRGNKVHAAGCVLPLTGSQQIGKNLGTRHRAGLGITEHSDALVLIVSEETGIISLARDGRMDRFIDKRTVEKQLLEFYLKPGVSERMEKVPWANLLFSRKKDKSEKKDSIFGSGGDMEPTEELPAEDLKEAIRKYTDRTVDLKDLKQKIAEAEEPAVADPAADPEAADPAQEPEAADPTEDPAEEVTAGQADKEVLK